MQAARVRQRVPNTKMDVSLLEFQVGDDVMFKVSPWKGSYVFENGEKLNRAQSLLKNQWKSLDSAVKKFSNVVIPFHQSSDGNYKWGPEFTWERARSGSRKVSEPIHKNSHPRSNVAS
ncbi:hypothetical protein Tco_0525535 [Tanacetum coccineum]